MPRKITRKTPIKNNQSATVSTREGKWEILIEEPGEGTLCRVPMVFQSYDHAVNHIQREAAKAGPTEHACRVYHVVQNRKSLTVDVSVRIDDDADMDVQDIAPMSR